MSVLLPAYMSIIENNYESSLVVDLDEEIEDIEITEDAELKIIPVFDTFINYKYDSNKSNIAFFIAKKYNPVFQKIDSPPPDFYYSF